MRCDTSKDGPVLTPERVIQLRGASLEEFRFDTAVLCFRGWPASDLMIETLGAEKVEQPLLYGGNCYRRTVGGVCVAVLPNVVWGGPVTAILLEELACLGVQTAIGYGAVGSLVSGAHIGRTFVAERAAGCDGTSRAYSDEVWIVPDPGLLALAERMSAEEGVSPLRGAVWTTDALYQERPSEIRRWRERGATLVNLECGPFYAVAAALGIRAVYLGLVTDFVSMEQDWQHGLWGQENTSDPLIVRIVRRVVETACGQELES